ncbi:MAG TPA: GMC family oxidoreductase [Longimicrobiales bacterium]
METSAVATLRTMHQALRRVVLSSWYSEPTVQAALGYAPRLEPAPQARAATLHTGARGLEPGRRLKADVVVIGSGAGGAVAAAILAESGRDVVVLEEGRAWPVTERTGVERDLVPRLYAEAGGRATDDLGVQILQGRALGGSTFVNWMLMLRTPDDVLQEWRSAHGFEVDDAAMRAAFDEIETSLHATRVPDSDHSRNNRILLDGAARLHASTSAGTINAKGCVRAGLCGLGCPWAAKQSTDETWLPRALLAGARIATGARVREIERIGAERGRWGATKRVLVEVLDAHGRVGGQTTIDAQVVVLAAGAVETPALLQRSGMGGGAVGRWLRLHPTSAVAALHAEPVHASAGIPLSVVCRPDASGYWIECPPFLPGLAAVAMPGFGERHRRWMERFTHIATNIVLVRDGAARAESQGDVRVDSAGRPRVRYRMGEAERRTMARGLTTAARLQLAAGAREVTTLHTHGEPIRTEGDLGRIAAWPDGPNELTVFSAHVMGSCRIGGERATSACAPDGQVRGRKGVYVLDGSLLPTAPGVNPQETIMALSLVLARRLAAGA